MTNETHKNNVNLWARRSYFFSNEVNYCFSFTYSGVLFLTSIPNPYFFLAVMILSNVSVILKVSDETWSRECFYFCSSVKVRCTLFEEIFIHKSCDRIYYTASQFISRFLLSVAHLILNQNIPMFAPCPHLGLFFWFRQTFSGITI